MILHADEYSLLETNQKHTLARFSLNGATEKMKQESYRNALMNSVKIVASNKPAGVLANLKDLVYTGADNFHLWVQKEVVGKLNNAGVQKLAIVRSNDEITRAMLDNFSMRANYYFMQTRFFDNETAANKWLSE
ncbi:MAG TPA: hypothetical protein DCQ31_04950 [Bacteroidales bacterium]|nr:hypothetical protein [Bacteroidales bacterium]